MKAKLFLFVIFSLILPTFVFAGTENLNITQIVFTSSPQTIEAGSISGVLSIQTQNASGTAEQVGITTTLNFNSSSGTGAFSSSNTSWSTTTTLTMNSNWANRNFYYRDIASGTHTLTISASDRIWTPATQTIVINPIVVPEDPATTTSTTTDETTATTTEETASSTPETEETATTTNETASSTSETEDIESTPEPITLTNSSSGSSSGSRIVDVGQVLGDSINKIEDIQSKLKEIENNILILQEEKRGELEQKKLLIWQVLHPPIWSFW